MTGAVLTALWLGILMSISPCPLASNIAAISFVGRQTGRRRDVLMGGLLYTVGRMLAYVILGALLTASLVSAPVLSHFLQKYMNRILGPVLILAGMLVLDMIRVNLPGLAMSDAAQKRLASWGGAGSFLMGVLFALSFCPVSAGLFFTGLLPLAVKQESRVLLPAAFGVGSGLPVIAFAVVLTFGVEAVARTYERMQKVEKWSRLVTGTLLIVVGIYLTLIHVYGVQLG